MIPIHKVFMPENIDEVIEPLREVLKSGWIGEGPKVQQFEKEIGEFLGAENVTALNSCTSALHLALRLCDVGIGDEVITTPMTCMATNEPIVLTGATPVWADVQPDTGNIDPESIRRKISVRTRVIMVVHWGGYPCDLDEINAIAREHGLKVIEDCAHAWGAEYHGKKIGTHSDFACFSLQAIKHFTTGDGGALICRDAAGHKRARSLRWFGIDREHRQQNQLGVAEWNIIEAGYKFHMNDIAATIGLAQLPHLPGLLAKRRENAAFFNTHLSGLEHVRLMQEQSDRLSSYWLYTIKVDERVRFIEYMNQNGIAASIVHGRNDRHNIFAHYNSSGLEGLDRYSEKMVCIPVGQWVGPEEREKIVKVIRGGGWVDSGTAKPHVVVVSEGPEVPNLTYEKPFNISVMTPDNAKERAHVQCFAEVADLLRLGLQELGYEVRYAGELRKDCTNIVLGYHMMGGARLPEGYDCIPYQLEEITESCLTEVDKMLSTLRSATVVWDFNERNIDFLKARGIPAIHKPLGFHAGIERIQQDREKDTDILFYGSRNVRRLRVLRKLSSEFKLKVLFGVYGKERDDWIARSRIVLSIYYYDTKYFDTVRMSYLMNNRAFTIVEDTPDRQYSDALVYVPFDEIPEACRYYLQKDSLRNSLAEKAFQRFSRERETDFLQRALDPRTLDEARRKTQIVTVVQQGTQRKSWMVEEPT